MDIDMRTIYSPCNHHHRDWMRTTVCDDVCNWETAGILHVIKACPLGIRLSVVQRFMITCVLPTQHGKSQPDFWQHPSSTSIAVQFTRCDRIAPHVDVFSPSITSFAPVVDIVDAVISFPVGEAIRVAMPPAIVWE